jgi:cell division protease FtsH
MTEEDSNSIRNRGDKGKQPPSGGSGGGPIRSWLAPVLVAMLLVYAIFSMQRFIASKSITYSEFRTHLDRGEVVECKVSLDFIEGKIKLKPTGEKKADSKKSDAKSKTEPESSQDDSTPKKSLALGKSDEFYFRTTRIEDPDLAKVLIEKKIRFEGERPSLFQTFLLTVLFPLGLLIVVWLFVMRRLGSAGESVLSFSRNRARLVADKDTGVTFEDVAGCQEAKQELEEVVEFLKAPDKYEALGARIPKGVLLVGPPGTGKTLLARAIAGEAKVPFYSISGSDFVEMFVGVGAARVRDLFQQAKRSAPCIIFIDEMDAIGRQRGVHVGAVNDEREQTLNQLLVEMDGFEANAGVILLAATNRPDVLDRALLRPGRFDRQVVVDAPDLEGRLAILKVHAKDKKLASGTELRRIAQSTPGFSGADLANTLNEAALLAVRRKKDSIDQSDLEEAVEKVYAGPERRSRRITDEDKRRIAYHEGGHALVAYLSKRGNEIRRITIVPRGRAAGYVGFMSPDEDRISESKSELLQHLRIGLAGRAAEEIVFNEFDTGAAGDLEMVTNLARRMVCMYGMGKSAGLMQCGEKQGPLYLAGLEGSTQLNCSEETAREIDIEVKSLLDQAYSEVKAVLTENRDKLDRIATELIKRETLDSKQFAALVENHPLAEANGSVDHTHSEPAADPQI